jgi:copper chaperone CopZ
VKNALAELPGVTNVEVDFATKTATVQATEDFDGGNAVQTLADAGFADSTVR